MSARIKLLRRIALLREVEHQAAARAAAQAEASRGEHARMAERTLGMARDYAARPGASDGTTLAQRLRFAGTLRAIHETSRADHDRASALADTRLTALAEAGRRRDAVRERVAAEVRADARVEAIATAPRRAPGTISDTRPGSDTHASLTEEQW